MLELDINGNKMAKNIRGLSLVKRTVTGKQLYYFNNAHGDVTTLVAPNGAISGKYYYDAFGNLVEEVDGEGNPYKYAGYEHDDETGLYYLRSRYYSSKSARFMSEDSFRGYLSDPLSLNLYTYCWNEPIMYWDPTGHYPQDGYLVEGTTSGINNYDVLSRGDKGEDVKLLQKALGIKADGIYGPATEKAVREFQEKNGLIADGQAGANTVAALLSTNDTKNNRDLVVALDKTIVTPLPVITQAKTSTQQTPVSTTTTPVVQKTKPTNEVSNTAKQGTGNGDQVRQQVVDLALDMVGYNKNKKITYSQAGEGPKTKKIVSSDGSLNIQTYDCQSLVTSIIYTVTGEDLRLDYKKVPRTNGGGADRLSQMGTEVVGFKNADGTINTKVLKPGDLIFMDYDKDGKNRSTPAKGKAGIYEHVMIYIGDNKYVDIGGNAGVSINNNLNPDINKVQWSHKDIGYIHSSIFTVRRVIQDDGTVKGVK